MVMSEVSAKTSQTEMYIIIIVMNGLPTCVILVFLVVYDVKQQ
jgi:hypothetical protein